MNKIILGIDQSFTSTGIVVLHKNTFLHHERFVSNHMLDEYDRADEIANHLVNIAAQYNPDTVAMEGISFGSRGDATRKLSGLLYLIVVHMRSLNINPIIIPPKTVKKCATGKGNASKEDMLAALPSNVRHRFIEAGYMKTKGLYDLTDAFHIAQVGKQIIKNGKETKISYK